MADSISPVSEARDIASRAPLTTMEGTRTLLEDLRLPRALGSRSTLTWETDRGVQLSIEPELVYRSKFRGEHGVVSESMFEGKPIEVRGEHGVEWKFEGESGSLQDSDSSRGSFMSSTE